MSIHENKLVNGNATNLYIELRVFYRNSNNHIIKEKQPKMNNARCYIEGQHGKENITRFTGVAYHS